MPGTPTQLVLLGEWQEMAILQTIKTIEKTMIIAGEYRTLRSRKRRQKHEWHDHPSERAAVWHVVDSRVPYPPQIIKTNFGISCPSVNAYEQPMVVSTSDVGNGKSKSTA